MLVTTTTTVRRGCSHPFQCACDEREVEVLVAGEVSEAGDEWLPEVHRSADLDGNLVHLNDHELSKAEDELCSEAERQVRLAKDAAKKESTHVTG